MSLFHRPPPPPDDGPVHLSHVEVSPDIVFVLSTSPAGTNPLGYFVSTGGNPQTYGWWATAPDTDNWLWIQVQPPAVQFSDTNWPATFYLVKVGGPGWQPPPNVQEGNTIRATYKSDGTWTGTGVPSATAPAWLLNNFQDGAFVSLGYAQRVGPTRTWYKSGNTSVDQNGAPLTTWPGNAIVVSSCLQLTTAPPGSPGENPRFTLPTNLL